MKRCIVLTGPKGAGKSTIGQLLATELGIHFVRVEPLFLEVRAELGTAHPDFERRGFESVLAVLEDAISRHDIVCFETIGASSFVPWLLSQLSRVARVLPVRVVADRAECLGRIRQRDASIHIPVSDDQVERLNELAAGVNLPWAAEIDNRGPFDANSILRIVREVIRESEGS